MEMSAKYHYEDERMQDNDDFLNGEHLMSQVSGGKKEEVSRGFFATLVSLLDKFFFALILYFFIIVLLTVLCLAVNQVVQLMFSMASETNAAIYSTTRRFFMLSILFI